MHPQWIPISFIEGEKIKQYPGTYEEYEEWNSKREVPISKPIPIKIPEKAKEQPAKLKEKFSRGCIFTPSRGWGQMRRPEKRAEAILFALIFFVSFLYQDKKERYETGIPLNDNKA